MTPDYLRQGESFTLRFHKNPTKWAKFLVSPVINNTQQYLLAFIAAVGDNQVVSPRRDHGSGNFCPVLTALITVVTAIR
jgi:hypothetical protein